MKRSILCVLLCVAPSLAFAELGRSTRDFKRSQLVRTYRFILDETIDVGAFSTMPGKERFLYKSGDGRYYIELISGKDETDIESSSLTFAHSLQPAQAEQDKACALEFFREATGGKVEEGVFLELYEAAARRIGSVQERAAGNIIMSVTVLRHAVTAEWNIVIRKKKP